jgi:hypothetical protein
MADRAVVQSGKDQDGDIIALCNPNASWSPRRKQDAIRDIETRTHTYYVPWQSGRTEIKVVVGRPRSWDRPLGLNETLEKSATRHR